MGLTALPDDVKLDAPTGNGLAALPDGVALDAAPSPHTSAQKFGHGAADTGYGLWKMLANYGPRGPSYVPASGVPGTLTPEQATASANILNQDIASREQKWQDERKATNDTGTEWIRGAGQATAALPLMAAVPELGEGIMGNAAGGAIQGAISGALGPTTSSGRDYAKDLFKNTGFGALFGAGTGAATGWLKSPSSAVNDEYRKSVNYLRERGVQPTVGQNIGPNAATAEDAASNVNLAVPFGQKRALNQFNVAALNEALAPISQAMGQAIKYTGDAGRKGIKAVGDLLSDRFNALKGSITLPITDEVKSSLNQLEQQLAVDAPPMASRLKTFLDQRLYNRLDGDGTLTGDAFKSVEEAFTKQAARYSKSLDGDQRAYSAALSDVMDTLRGHLATANPDKAAELGALNKGWAVLARIEDAVPTGNPEGLFTPYQLARATETADSSVRHRAYVRGEALLQPLTDSALRVLGNRYPNSGTFGRALAGTTLMGGGAAHFLNPVTAAGLASSALLYTPWGQRLAGSAINDLPGTLGAKVLSGARLPATSAATMGFNSSQYER